MKKNEIEIYIKKYIIPKYQDYAQSQYLLYKTFENNFFIKGYLFFSKGDNEFGLKVTFFVMPLFVKEDRITYTVGEDLFYKHKEGIFKTSKNIWWDVRKEMQEKTFIKISESFYLQSEPFLNKFNTAKDYFQIHQKEKKGNIRVFESVAYTSILYAPIETQNKLLQGLIREAENEDDYQWVHQIKADAILLLNEETQKNRLLILKQWANETISHLKLPHLKPFTL